MTVRQAMISDKMFNDVLDSFSGRQLNAIRRSWSDITDGTILQVCCEATREEIDLLADQMLASPAKEPVAAVWHRLILDAYTSIGNFSFESYVGTIAIWVDKPFVEAS